jgi:hypothetical protein
VNGWHSPGVGIQVGRIWIREGGDFLVIVFAFLSFYHGRGRDEHLDVQLKDMLARETSMHSNL